MRNESPFLWLVIGIIGITSAASAWIQADQINELQRQPTYHCDGSETRGFAEPGSPEASACWFEVKK